MLKWLVSVDPSPNHNRALGLHEEHTGQWMLCHREWKKWLDRDIRFLWIYGIPGAGKTTLLSFLIENAKNICDQPSSQSKAWAYYYCYHARNHDETNHCLRWILSQLCRQLHSLPSEIREMYQRGEQPATRDLLNALAAVTRCFDTVYILIDALDESQNREYMATTLASLMLQERFRAIQLITTSRDEVEIRRAFYHCSFSRISMSNELVEEDIRKYIRSRLSHDSRFARWPKSLLKDVEQALAKEASGMYVSSQQMP